MMCLAASSNASEKRYRDRLVRGIYKTNTVRIASNPHNGTACLKNVFLKNGK